MSGLRTRLAGYRCPHCGAPLDYRMVVPAVSAVLQEGGTVHLPCTACRRQYSARRGSAQAPGRARRVWGFGVVAVILFGLAITGLATAVGLPGWVSAISGLAVGAAPLPFLDAYARRGLGRLVTLKERQS